MRNALSLEVLKQYMADEIFDWHFPRDWIFPFPNSSLLEDPKRPNLFLINGQKKKGESGCI